MNSIEMSEDALSLSEKDYVVEEINLDHHTMRSIHNSIDKEDNKESQLLASKLQASTNDVIEYSSIRDHKSHEIFTSDTRVKLGKIRMDNGSIYEGEWLHGLPNGSGVMNWQNGSIYAGQWDNGIAHGLGKLLFFRGEYYEGNFVLDKAEGYGEYYFKDGTVYKGQWAADKQNGKGTETWADGTLYVGEY